MPCHNSLTRPASGDRSVIPRSSTHQKGGGAPCRPFRTPRGSCMHMGGCGARDCTAGKMLMLGCPKPREAFPQVFVCVLLKDRSRAPFWCFGSLANARMPMLRHVRALRRSIGTLAFANTPERENDARQKAARAVVGQDRRAHLKFQPTGGGCATPRCVVGL